MGNVLGSCRSGCNSAYLSHRTRLHCCSQGGTATPTPQSYFRMTRRKLRAVPCPRTEKSADLTAHDIPWRYLPWNCVLLFFSARLIQSRQTLETNVGETPSQLLQLSCALLPLDVPSICFPFKCSRPQFETAAYLMRDPHVSSQQCLNVSRRGGRRHRPRELPLVMQHLMLSVQVVYLQGCRH